MLIPFWLHCLFTSLSGEWGEASWSEIKTQECVDKILLLHSFSEDEKKEFLGYIQREKKIIKKEDVLIIFGVVRDLASETIREMKVLSEQKIIKSGAGRRVSIEKEIDLLHVRLDEAKEFLSYLCGYH